MSTTTATTATATDANSHQANSEPEGSTIQDGAKRLIDDITRTVSPQEVLQSSAAGATKAPESKRSKIDHDKLTQAKSCAPKLGSPFVDSGYSNLLPESSSKILFATDEWFARAENLIADSDPLFVPDLYCEQGKVMDGWESRRRRTEGHDWCVIAAGAASEVNDVCGIEIDTAFFTGNQTPRISIDVANCYSSSASEDEEWMYTWMPGSIKRLVDHGGIQGTGQSIETIQKAKKACEKFDWKEILPVSELKPGYEETRMHYFVLSDAIREQAKGFTHVRVNYFPDGGVARLRLWGYTSKRSKDTSAESSNNVDTKINLDLPSSKPYKHPELSLSTNGGIGLSCSNKHYGVPSNLIRPTYGKDMGDGWETARHPDRPPILIKDPATGLIDNPLMDWAVIRLGMGGAIENGISRIILDTKHFKGNFPESVKVEGCNANANSPSASDEMVCSETPELKGKEGRHIDWFPLLERTKMGPDQEHSFLTQEGKLVNCEKAVTHVRVSIYPDGGLSRVRIYGQPINVAP